MRKLRTLRVGGALGAVLLCALAACALFAVAGAAQSGRRRPAPQTPQAQPSPAATPESESESESESRPRPADLKARGVLVSFAIMEQDDVGFGASHTMMDDVAESFRARLGSSASISVTSAGRGTRSTARQLAKGERETYVVLIGLEDERDPMSRGTGTGRSNHALIVRTTLFEPQTGAIKYTDAIYQRPVRETVRVGGIGLPVPTRTINRYPSEHELRQAARDAADRILARFHLVTPPDQP